MAILKQAEDGAPVTELSREHGMSSVTFYKWRSKYGGMDASIMARMKELEQENVRLKRMYADVQLRHDVLRLPTSCGRTEFAYPWMAGDAGRTMFLLNGSDAR